jgi:hypothetical protein
MIRQLADCFFGTIDKQSISETISNAARAFTFVSLKARHYLAQALLLFLKSNEKHCIRSS